MKYNKDTKIMRVRLTPEEEKELNKRTRAKQQSLNYRRHNPKAQFQNMAVGIGATAVGAGLGYGALKGGKKVVNKLYKHKENKINDKFYKTVYENKDKLLKAVSEKDFKLATNDSLRKAIGQRIDNNIPAVISAGAITGLSTGHIGSDRLRVNNFFKENYGDMPYKSIRMNEKKRILEDREKQAFDIINDSFEKIAKLTEEEMEELKQLNPEIQRLNKQNAKDALGATGRAYAGVGGLYGSTAIINKARRSGEIDGVVRRYHNTRAENVKGIKEKGILSEKALDKDNLTSRTTGLTSVEKKGKTYLAKDRGGARAVGTRRQQLDNGLSAFYTPDPQQAYLQSFKNHKTMKVNIPLDEYKKLNTVANPELRGAKTLKEVLQKNKAGEIPGSQFEAIMTHLKLNKGTDTVLGDIPSKFIKGGKGYQKRTLKDIGRHIKNNPKIFAKGLGKAGLGTLGVAGSAYVLKGDKEANQRMKEFRENKDVKRYNELTKKMYGFK